MELLGFKSFVDKTTISFAGGILCIVGPNGCGKSNLVDAFRWVLGEQSVKSLRSDRMEEVIFQGSSSKKQRGLAEVSLTFARPIEPAHDSQNNKTEEISQKKDEITLTRRLYRSGESEYLLNKRQCRLKDIRDILLSAGIDPKSYSIFDHIRVSDIINAKPHEKRFILEEIAGAAKYRVKKQEADAKLEASRQNLIRLNDIVYEIKKQMTSLERQVRKAERYKKLFDELRLVELRIAKAKHAALTSTINSLVSEVEMLAISESAKRAECSANENMIEAKRLEIAVQQGKLSLLREKLNEIEMTISKSERNIAVLKTLIENKSAEISRLTQQSEAAQVKKNELLSKLSEITRNEQALKANADSLSNELKDKRDSLQDIEESLSEKDSAIESKRRELFSMTELISSKRNEYNKITSSSENLKYKQSVSIRDMNSIKGSISATEGSISDSETSLVKMQVELKELLSEKERIQTEAVRIQKDMEDIKAHIYKGKENIASQMSRLESLKELLAENPFRGILTHENRHSFSHTLSDFIRVNNGYENAIEAAFSEKINSLVIDKKEDLFTAINIIKERNLDRTCLLYTGMKNGLNDNKDNALSEIAGGEICGADQNENISIEPLQKASCLVAFEVNGGKDMIMPVRKAACEILNNIYVVNDLNAAIEICHSEKFSNRTIVTLEGEIITPEGIIITGKGKEILKRKNEIKELHKTIAEERNRIKCLEKGSGELLSGISIQHKALKGIEGMVSELHKAIALNEQNLKNLRDDIYRKNRKLSFLETDIKALSQEQDSLNKAFLSVEDDITNLEAKKIIISDELSLIQNSLLSIKKEYEITSEHINDLRVSVTSSREKIYAINKEKDSISEMLIEIQKKNDTRNGEISEGLKKLADSSKELEDLKGKIKLSLQEADKIRGSLSAKNDEIYIITAEVSQKESGLKGLRTEADELLKSLSNAKTGLMECGLRSENIENMIMQKYSVKISGYNFEPTDYNTEQDEKSLAGLSEKIKEFGVPNFASIEEFEELGSRYDFLVKQKLDLETSITELEDAIRKINNTTKKRLREAYDTLRIKFSEIFSELFGGGKADLVLTDENDILHSGIEIIAQPPGKKLQNLNLLSGGEKALTTLAMMFAGFMIRPMPLCILDEVDAPLDESNTTRFAQMLRRFSSHTQFLVITHNRATMEIADFLHGITMEEPGSSKLISLRFTDVAANGELKISPQALLP